ncbi:lysosomal membrane ascorbate-dependent ferrireductase CYB561A3 isoform X1 [Nelusetta ayraudi]|uniref:lysosomal membrane ascorbate-dependent ferrireductase CYB561A3 isoform X1 n=2 Tax=Nelusetta ayraudi TaxID=303726 RepID=UPI003F6F6A16
MSGRLDPPDPADSSCSSSAADSFPLRRLLPLPAAATAEPGSERAAGREKSEVRAGSSCASVSAMSPLLAFYLCYMLCLGLGAACVATACLWSSRWRGGFAWDGTALQFNWHPVLMVAGLVVVYGYGAVLYRVPLTWGQNKRPWKLLHGALMLLALVLAVLGLCAVFDFHNANGTPNLYSLHSWVGVATAALFAAQWAVGVATFLLPCSPASLRKFVKPVHVFLGATMLSLSAVACVSGINEKLFFVLKGNGTVTQPYSQLPPEAVLGNSLGVLIVAFVLLVLMMLSNRKWQRPDDAAAEQPVYSPLLQEEN